MLRIINRMPVWFVFPIFLVFAVPAAIMATILALVVRMAELLVIPSDLRTVRLIHVGSPFPVKTVVRVLPALANFYRFTCRYE